MVVRIRLRRVGKKKRPFYRIVAADHRKPTDGRFLENVGTYDPLSNPEKLTLKTDSIKAWLSKGAQPSDTVRSILRRQGFFKKA